MVRDIQNKHTCEISVVFWDFTVLISDLSVQGIKYQNCNIKPGKRHKFKKPGKCTQLKRTEYKNLNCLKV